MNRSDMGHRVDEPDVLLMPFAVPEGLGDVPIDDGILARRIPDFLHHLLNGGLRHGSGGGPTSMLEVQSPPDDGPAHWVTLTDPPEPEDVFRMLGGEAVRALVTGTLRSRGSQLILDLNIHFAPEPVDTAAADPLAHVPRGVHGVVRLDDPVRGLCRIAEHLAAVLRIPFATPLSTLLTANSTAFFRFLEGLDGAALLAGDADLEPDRRGAELFAPLADALVVDPGFGLALRAVASTLSGALAGVRVERAECLDTLDRCLDAAPSDGEGCVAVAEQLAVSGDEERAARWLRHAVALEPPAPRALECLGVLMANRGDTAGARELWLRGIEEDGDPDFFAHLSRLHFANDERDDAWDKVLRGLWRIWERATRSAEWNDVDRPPSVLLRYLSDHLEDGAWPDDVADALLGLAGLLHDPQERIDLGLCLAKIGQPDLARHEIESGLEQDVAGEVEDRAVRALLALQIPGFEKRFADAAERAVGARDPRPALVEMQAFLEWRPEFWPAVYFTGVALRRLGQSDEAIDLMAEVLERRPGQTDALVTMAELFDERGNPKRALECIEEALGREGDDAELHVQRARLLERLGRSGEAAAALDRAVELEPASRPRRSFRLR